MCLAIYKPRGIQLKKKHLSNGFDNNSDGAGFAVARHGKITIHKGFFTFSEFWNAFEPYVNDSCVIHFRFATHGKCTVDNCHPFSICAGKYAVIHNGILPIETKSYDTMSDTWHFATRVLEPQLKLQGPANPALRYLVECTIGDNNKIVILKENGEAVIYNESSGHWHGKAWYSNDGYKHRSLPIGFGTGALGASWRDWQKGWKSTKELNSEIASYHGSAMDDYDPAEATEADTLCDVLASEAAEEMERREAVNRYLAKTGYNKGKV